MSPTITGDRAGRTNDYMPLVLLNDQGGDSISVEKNNISPTLRSQSHGNQPVIAYSAGFSHKNSAKASIGFETETAPTLRAGQVSAVVYAIGNGQANQTSVTDKVGALNCMHDQQIIMMATQQGGAEIAYNLCPTITAAAGTSGNNQPVLCAANDAMRYIVRRLTPLECERLQGYPDGWTDIGPWTDDNGKLHNESSDTARYRSEGNSLAIPCAERVIGAVADCIDRHNML